MNLWTVGCANSHLTAPCGSLWTSGKTPWFPTLPTGRRLPTSFTAPRNKNRKDGFDFGER